MLISFTQTYGDDRRDLFRVYERDQRLIEFKNQFDVNIYSFHNSSPETVNFFKEKNRVNNVVLFEFDNVNYTQSFKKTLELLEDSGCTHLFFSQDDTFSDDNEDLDIPAFVDFFKGKKKNFMTCLSIPFDRVKKGIKKPKTLAQFGDHILYENHSLRYKRNGINGMTDDPYIATFDVVKRLYNSEYFRCNDIWRAEGSLGERFNEEKIPRHILNKPIFKNYNVIGTNNWDSENLVKQLKTKGLI